MGGEKRATKRLHECAQGSPPRGRGKEVSTENRQQGHRITPAWAGKRNCCFSRRWYTWDHPRVGGEKLLSEWGQGWPLGSPPRGRGKENVPGPQLGAERITPAWAGKSLLPLDSWTLWRDHPRVGGEKLKHPKYTTDEGGSPPRGRGKARL